MPPYGEVHNKLIWSRNQSHIAAAALWIRLIILSAGKSKHEQILPFPLGDPGPIKYHDDSLGLTSLHQTVCISIDLIVFCGAGACDPAMDRHMHRPCYMCSAHHMLRSVTQPKSYFASPHPAHLSIWPTYVRRQLCAFSCYFANFQSKRWLKLFSVSVWSNFDSIFELLNITLVASSNANEVEDRPIDLG